MIQSKDIDAIMGADVVDGADDRIGKVSQVYVDSQDQHPSWIAVKTGFFGNAETLVPIEDAAWDSATLHVGVSKATVRDAPHIDPDREITVEEQNRLYQHYGIGAELRPSAADGGADRGAEAESAPDTTQPVAAPEPVVGVPADGAGAHRAEPAEQDSTDIPRPAALTDASVQPNEVQPVVEQQAVEQSSVVESHFPTTGAIPIVAPGYRMRLRKVVVTEQRTVTVTVPVSHEEVRLERVPDDEPDGPDVIRGETDVVLMAERPVVTTEQVAVERVHVVVNPVDSGAGGGV